MNLKRQTIACTSCVPFINFNAKPRLQDIVTVYYTLHRWNWFFCLWYYQRWSILLLLIQTFLVVCTTYLAFPVQNKCHCKTLHNSHCPCFWGLSLYKNPPLKPFLHILISRSDSAVQMCQTSCFLHNTQYTCCLSYLKTYKASFCIFEDQTGKPNISDKMLLHVEVVVARKVGMQNEFLDFVVLCIEKDVLQHQSA